MCKEYKVDINKEMEILAKDVDKNFERIVEINKPVIMKVIGSVFYNSPITFDDLYQESLIELYNTSKKYRKVSVSFTSYFMQNLKNVLINYIQRNQFNLTIPYNVLRSKSYSDLSNYISSQNVQEIEIADSHDYFEEFEDEQDIFIDDRINKVKSILKEKDWQMIKIMANNNNNLAEYARQTGVSREAARQRWNKIQKKIKEKL